jgi:para-aminobenzoate synthetase component 1
LDNNNYNFETPAFECILAIGANESIELSNENLFDQLKSFAQNNPGWLFGHINYPSSQQNEIGFPSAYFFQPEIMVTVSNNQVCISSNTNKNTSEIFQEIELQSVVISKNNSDQINCKPDHTQEGYLEKLKNILAHIQRGDCYEINFCRHFFSNDVEVNPTYLYQQLKTVSPNPFASFYKLRDKYCICSSPERFLKKTGDTVISQPIKGTSRRDLNDLNNDEQLKNKLKNSPKERSENVMIVDLVRNDLSKIATEGSVTVKELFEIYSFPQVHQMISTIAGNVDKSMHWTEIIDACFPMGSMTGAPKKKVMDLIEKYETVPRGLFSGTIGYITPEGDFDFNVIIRSLFYNETKKHLAYFAGGGITINSNPIQEFEETNVKVSAIESILKSQEN